MKFYKIIKNKKENICPQFGNKYLQEYIQKLTDITLQTVRFCLKMNATIK